MQIRQAIPSACSRPRSRYDQKSFASRICLTQNVYPAPIAPRLKDIDCGWYLGPSLYGLQLAAFLDHFERTQVVVVASEVLRDSPREALTAVFDHIGVDPAAVDLDERHRDHRSLDKPVPRLHDLHWLPRRQLKLDPRWRPDQRTGLSRLLTTRGARAADSAIPRELRDRLVDRLAPDLSRFEHLLGYAYPVSGPGRPHCPRC
jgi:hypothetical protein